MEALSMGKPYAGIVNRAYVERVENLKGVEENHVGAYVYEEEARWPQALTEKALASDEKMLKAYKKLAKEMAKERRWDKLIR